MRTALNQLYSEGRVYSHLTGYVDEPVWVRLNEAGDLVYLDLETAHERVLTSFARPAPGWFEAPLRGCDQEGRAHTDAPYSGPTGRFAETLPVIYRSFSCADAGLEHELFAENVGMVSRTLTTIAGPVTYKLVYADTRAVQLAPRPSATLRLSVETVDDDNALARLRLTGDPETAPKLTFASSQEFEMVLRHADGRVVWRWSDGRVFLQATVERQAANLLWEATIPLASGAGRLPAGDYTVEAWLNTVGPETRYRVMAALAIAGEPAPDAMRPQPMRARVRR